MCVVGEFKKGKSALINALLGSDVCPVDDDLATMAVTVVRYAPEPGAIVRRREAGELLVEAIPADEVGRWVAERDGDELGAGVEVVEVGLPNPFLERGIALVDTPGVGGLNAAHAAATLAFLPSADALVFVTDASTELSAPGAGVPASARSAGPPILIAVTKVDIYPEWRRIVAIDEGHLAAMGLDEAPFALSSVLRAHGLATGRPGARERERLPGVRRGARRGRRRPRPGGVLCDGRRPGPARARPAPRAAGGRASRRSSTRTTAERLAADLRDVRVRLADPGRGRRLLVGPARGRVRRAPDPDRVRVPGADASARCGRRQDEIERIDPARAWPEVGQRIQAETAAAVRAAFLEATDGAAAIQGDDRRTAWPTRRSGSRRRRQASPSTWRRCGRAARRSRAAPSRA